MIKSFRDKDTERLFLGLRSRIPPDIAATALRKLAQLNAAVLIGDLAIFPGNRLEALKGDRAGRHSLRINDQWRVCFLWEDGDAYEVEIVDYH
jgi:toxin HigB-1